MEKLVTSSHAGVKEERNGVGKFCNMSSMKEWSPVHMLVLKRRGMLLVSSVNIKYGKTGHQFSCWCQRGEEWCW